MNIRYWFVMYYNGGRNPQSMFFCIQILRSCMTCPWSFYRYFKSRIFWKYIFFNDWLTHVSHWCLFRLLLSWVDNQIHRWLKLELRRMECVPLTSKNVEKVINVLESLKLENTESCRGKTWIYIQFRQFFLEATDFF